MIFRPHRFLTKPDEYGDNDVSLLSLPKKRHVQNNLNSMVSLPKKGHVQNNLNSMVKTKTRFYDMSYFYDFTNY